MTIVHRAAALMIAGLLAVGLWQGRASAQDHPLVGRYQGADLVFQNAKAFDETLLLTGPFDRLQQRRANAPGWTAYEGKVTQLRYAIPEGRSSLEVLRSFEQALQAKGFRKQFACTDVECMSNGTPPDIHEIGAILDPQNRVPSLYEHKARYSLMVQDRPEGAISVALFVGEFKGNATQFVEIVEKGGMDQNKIATPSSDQMRETLERSGKIDLYSILFDYNKDVLRPESRATLSEIAKLMQQSPALRLNVVGHTDNQGGVDYNLNLSRRRAAAVVGALVGGFGIDAGRLTSNGEGFARPVAPNDTEEGRAKNRRVELIRQ